MMNRDWVESDIQSLKVRRGYERLHLPHPSESPVSGKEPSSCTPHVASSPLGGPTVSVGMPVFNGENFLVDAIESILNQTLSDFELIISDNCSTDRTREICMEYARRDERIRYHRTAQNYGAAWNYNVVADSARGMYFKWAAHDDVLAPTFLEKCVNVLNNDKDIVLCYPQTTIIDTKGSRVETYDADHFNLVSDSPRERFKQYLSVRRGSLMCSPIFGVFRRVTLEKTLLIGPFDASDFVLLGHTSLLGKIQEFPEPLFYYRAHEDCSVNALTRHGTQAVAGWFDPANHHRLHLPRFRWLDEYFRILGSVDLSLQDKIRCLSYIVAWVPTKRKDFARDIIRAIHWPVARRRLRPAVN